MGQAAAVARLREALVDVIDRLTGDTGRVRAQQADGDQAIVEQAVALLEAIDGRAGEGQDSPGRRAAIAAGMDRDAPRDDRHEPTPGQRAAQRARRRRGGVFQ